MGHITDLASLVYQTFTDLKDLGSHRPKKLFILQKYQNLFMISFCCDYFDQQPNKRPNYFLTKSKRKSRWTVQHWSTGRSICWGRRGRVRIRRQTGCYKYIHLWYRNLGSLWTNSEVVFKNWIKMAFIEINCFKTA